MNEKQNAMSQTNHKCDVFISYRRDGGDMTAMYFFQALKERGYNVFYDLEVLRAGKFNDALLSSIQSCKDFVLILSPGALDRCNDENDWVRKEIAEALRSKKNIVPVMLKGFQFPEKLPEDIEDVRYQNGLTCTTEYFEESINRLCQRYLKSLPMDNVKKKAMRIAIAAAAVVALAVGGFLALRGGNHPEPATIPAATAEATAEPTAEPTPEPTPEPTEEPVQVVQNTDFPFITQEIDWIDGNQIPLAENETSIRQNSKVLNHPTIRRRDIASVTFLPSLEGAPEDAWDVSEEADGRVLAWAVPNGELYDLTIAGDGGVSFNEPSSFSSKLFEDYVNVTSINFNGCVDFSGRSTMREMFCGCEALRDIDFTGVCFDHILDMSYMFADCVSMETLDTSPWQASRVNDMEGMFMDSGFTELDLSGLYTSSVTTMANTFSNCRYLTELDLSGLDTHSVITMESMFEECSNLDTLDLSGFDTSRVIDMTYMFDDCWSLVSLDTGSFDTSRVTDMHGMFQNCSMLETLDLYHFNTARVKDMSEMFRGCLALANLDIQGWDTGHVQDMSGMFEGCGAIYSLDLTHFDTHAVTDMQLMFHDCDYAVELLTTGWDVSGVQSMNGMFQGCTALESIGRDPATFGHGDTQDMYDGCMKLEGI